jgi:tetraacyldisaccharide 4'-kinase
LNPLGALYGTLARARRARYARHPHLRRRLHRPVISVGNLVVGGSGKTPVVAAIARMLQEAGERPVILSRGYARRHGGRDPLVVSDGARVREDVERSGDEPQMLARALPGVPVVVAADRHAAGLVAEASLQATVLVLDDAFQHLQLAREIDLLVMGMADLDERLLPAGRLREPLSAAHAADAVIVQGNEADARQVSAGVGVDTAFYTALTYEVPRSVAPFGASLPQSAGGRAAVAVAGIARPERFFAAAMAQGWDVRRKVGFRDHHWFSASDVERIEKMARDAGADVVITTEKDAVRLEPLLRRAQGGTTGTVRISWIFLPMRVSIEPAATFRSWLAMRLAAARATTGLDA